MLEGCLARQPAGLDIVGVHTSSRVDEVPRVIDHLVHIVKLRQLVVGPPLVAPDACSWQYVTLDNWRQCSGVASADNFHKESSGVEIHATKHCDRIGRPCAFPGVRRATTISSTATGLAISSAEQTARMKLNQLITVFSSTCTCVVRTARLTSSRGGRRAASVTSPTSQRSCHVGG